MNLLLISATITVCIVGAALAFQAPINATLARSMGDPIWAAALSFGIGFILLSGIAIAKGAELSTLQFKTIPWWALTGGALGALWVLAAIWSVPRLGVMTMFSAMILGQMIAAVLIDAGGIMGLAAREISHTRLASISFIIIGVILSYR